MPKLSNRVNRLNYAETFVMSNKVRELTKKGIDIINLTLGQPDYDIPNFIKKSAKKAIDEGFNSYTPIPGYMELRQAISKKFERDNYLYYKENEIIISNGVKQTIINILMALINKGDEVIIPTPYWVSYYEMVKLVGGKAIFIDTNVENNFKITSQQLQKAISKKTKAFLFSSPCNPSGSIYSKDELLNLVNIFKKYPDIMIISDEIYEYINYQSQHVSIASFPEVFKQTATINGISKAFSMTGWRIGYMGGPQWLIDACDKIQGQTTSGANCIAQRASITAIQSDPIKIKFMIDSFYKRRNLVYQLLQEIKGFKTNLPEGAFYFFPDISYFFGKKIKGYNIKNSNDFVLFLLEIAHVASVSGTPFGNKNCIRLSYAASENQLIKAIQRIKKAIV